MGKVFSIKLEKITCFKESDGKGHSEPYIWPILLVINDSTLATTTPVQRVVKSASYDQIVLKKDMERYDAADIPEEIGLFKKPYPDQLKTDYFILVVLLWEKDESPRKAVLAGYNAFCRSVPAAITENLPALAGSGEADLVNLIKERVKNDVYSAIKNSLSTMEQINVSTGVLNLDDFVGVDFKVFKNRPVTSGFTTFLMFQSEDEKNQYLISGTVKVTLT